MISKATPVGPRRLLIIGVLLINLVVIVLAGVSIRQSRLQYEERAAITTQNLSQVLVEYISGVIAKTDVTLQSVVDEAEKQLVGGGIKRQVFNQYIRREVDRIPEIDDIGLTDSKGDMLYGIPVSSPVNVSDRDYFRHFSNAAPHSGLFISKPILGRILKKWQVFFVRPYNNSDGFFAGVAIAALPLEKFSETFSRVNVGNYGTITLFDGELTIVCRYTHYQESGSFIGKKIATTELRELIGEDKTSGTYRARASTDNMARMFSFRKVATHPLYIVVGLARDEYLAEWRRETVGILVFVALFISATFFLSMVTYRKWQGERQAIEELTKTKDELEMRVTERTADLAKANENLHIELSERQQAETALRQSEQRYRQLFESANDGILILDETGFIDCNRRGTEMYRRTREEVIGHSPVELSPERQPDGRLSSEGVAERIHRAMNNIPQVFEWQSLRPDGSAFDVEVTLNRLDMAGKVCLQAIVRDITDRKRLEMEISKTQKLESLGTLAGGIAHDFNNLLQGVFGYISMAKLHLDQRHKSFTSLEQAERALQMSVNLTTQLLTFSKGGKPVRRRTDLRPLIENTVKFTLSGSKVDYKIEADEALRPAEVDEGQIGQVIQNIVLNAEQAMPAGGTITIKAENFDMAPKGHPYALAQGNYIVISIQDSGIGIPEEYLPKIFDPYFTTKDRGSGIGLTTSYSIIRNHGGVIEVKSEMGKGSTFSICLPAIEAAPEQVQPEKSSEAPRRKGRILLMDDEKIVRDIAGEMIRTLGHEAEFAVNGEEVIAEYQESLKKGHPYDVVILDLTIRGGMGGEAALKSLIKLNPDIKVVMSSGYADSSAVSNYKSLGFRSCLAKPYNIDLLNDTLNALLA